MSEENYKIETITVDEVEYKVDDLPEEVQQRVAILNEWKLDADRIEEEKVKVQQHYNKLNLEGIKIQLALSALGEEVSQLVRNGGSQDSEEVVESESE